MARFSCVVFLLVSAAVSPIASVGANPTATIVGMVMEEGKPAGYANVIIQGTRLGTMTREDGLFRLENVPPGSQKLIAQAIYCDRKTLSLSLAPGQTDTLVVMLECPLIRCVDAGKANLVAGCFQPNAAERSRVGLPCPIHPAFALALDTVRISYGLQIYNPMERDSFPNAGMGVPGGCVPRPIAFTEFAYCTECRRAWSRYYDRRLRLGGHQ